MLVALPVAFLASSIVMSLAINNMSGARPLVFMPS